MIQPKLLAVGPISESGKPTFEDPYDQASDKKDRSMFIDGQLPDAWKGPEDGQSLLSPNNHDILD